MSDLEFCVKHSVTPAEMYTIFSQDFIGIFNTAVLTIKTASGSIYEIILVGPTITTNWDGRSVQVRRADYSTRDEGSSHTIVLGGYIGILRGKVYNLVLISNIEEDESLEDIERTRKRSEPSSPILPETVVTFGSH